MMIVDPVCMERVKRKWIVGGKKTEEEEEEESERDRHERKKILCGSPAALLWRHLCFIIMKT